MLRHPRPPPSHHHTQSPIQRCPPEVVSRIALWAELLQPLGPAIHHAALLKTCKHVYNALRGTSHFLADVQRAKFDRTAAARRFGLHATRASNLAAQLTRNSVTIARIHSRSWQSSEEFLLDLWNAFLLLSEDDGKNRAQLEWAHTYEFVNDWVNVRIWHGHMPEHQWPTETPEGALALWIMWMMTTPERLAAESADRRQRMIDLLRPFVMLAPRYPPFVVPDNHFVVPLASELQGHFPHSFLTPHGPYPPYRNPESAMHSVPYLGGYLRLGTPLAGQAARLLLFARRERSPLEIPEWLAPDRAHAPYLPPGEAKPTQADIAEVNAAVAVRFVPVAPWEWLADLAPAQRARELTALESEGLQAPSTRWDDDLTRILYCTDGHNRARVPYRPLTHGLLSGRWVGRSLVPTEHQYPALVSATQMPAEFGEFWPWAVTQPILFTLREHHCVAPEHPARVGGPPDDMFDDGVCNGWFVEGTEFRDTSRGMQVTDGQDGISTLYRDYDPASPLPHDPETCRMCAERRRQQAACEELEEGEVPPEELEAGDGHYSDSEDEAPPSADRTDDDSDDRSDNGSDEGSDDGAGPDTADAADAGAHDRAPPVPRPFLGAGYYERRGVEVRPAERACDGVMDVILTGFTEQRHGLAWHHYDYYGRVRPWDGLITIVREPRFKENGHGRFILRGYIVGGTTFVGTWRVWSDRPAEIPWESAVILSRQDDIVDAPA